MKNAKQELLHVLLSTEKIKCASIDYDEIFKTLKLNYTDDDYIKFLNSLDFIYDNGYGRQELFGTVWL